MTVTAIDRCLGLIEVLAGEAEPLELSELASRVQLPNSAAHRILSEEFDARHDRIMAARERYERRNSAPVRKLIAKGARPVPVAA